MSAVPFCPLARGAFPSGVARAAQFWNPPLGRPWDDDADVVVAPPLTRHCAPLSSAVFTFRHIQPPFSEQCRAFTVRAHRECTLARLGARFGPHPAALPARTAWLHATILGIRFAALCVQRALDVDARPACSLLVGAAKEAQEGKLQGAAAASAEGSLQGVAAEQQQQQKQQSGSGQVRPSRRAPRSAALAARRSAPGARPAAGP